MDDQFITNMLLKFFRNIGSTPMTSLNTQKKYLKASIKNDNSFNIFFSGHNTNN